MKLNVNFGGGLGNQMFKYAFTLSLLEKYPDARVYKDTKIMSPKAHNGFELDKNFGITIPECNENDIQMYKKFCYEKKDLGLIEQLYYRGARILLPKPKTLIWQKDFSEFYPEVYNLKDDKSYYVYGVWANEKYFAGIKDTVKKSFRFRNVLSSNAHQYWESIKANNSVSIHIRRGDYAEWGHQLLGVEYYDKAISIISERQENVKFFIFSDDIEESKYIFSKHDNFVYVDCRKTDNSAVDMYLMSQCKHNICANSTFSFWGAYLNSHPKKIVISCKEPLGMLKNPITCKEWINI